MKNYVGRKIRGFRFEDGTDEVKWFDDMDRHIGSIGKIYKQNDTTISVEFENWYCDYPISLVEQHLLEDGNTYYGMKSLTDTITGCNSQAIGYIKLNDNQTPEIPQLGEGVFMEVSDDGVDWTPRKVVGQLQNGYFVTDSFPWKKARHIQQLPKYTHAELVERLGHEFEYQK
jgi:hypothetical protein